MATYKPKRKTENGLEDVKIPYSIVDGVPYKHYKRADVTGVAGTSTTQISTTYSVTDATISSYFDGMMVSFVLPVAGVGTYGSVFRINSLEYKPIVFGTNSSVTTRYPVGSQVTMVYNSVQTATAYLEKNKATTVTGCWQVMDYDSTTTDARRTYDYYLRPYVGANKLYRYKLCALDKDNRLNPITITNQTSSTQVAKTPSSVALKIDKLWIYVSSTDVNAGTVVTAKVLSSQGYYDNYCQYNFNASIPAYRMIYLRGTYDHTTGLFTLYNDGSSPCTSYYTSVPNNTANINLSSYFTSGYYYWLVGCTYSTADYLQLFAKNPLYYFDGTNLVDFTKPSIANKLDKSGGTMTGAIVVGSGNNKGITLPDQSNGTGMGTNYGTNYCTLMGFVGSPSKFSIGHSNWQTNIRGSATRPTYNGNDLALKSDIITPEPVIVNDGILKIQKNGIDVAIFTANDADNVTANIAVPTKTSDLTNDSNFVADANYVHTDNNFTDTYKGKITTNESNISTINDKIPSQATSSNQLADKDFVNSSIATNTAYFKGTLDATTDLGLTKPASTADVVTALNGHTFSPAVTNNDYCVVINSDSNNNTLYQRYKYNATAPATWGFEYAINNSSFTANQWAAINSGLSSSDKTKLDGIADGAEVNVQSDWNQTDTTADDYIKNKPDIPSVSDATIIINQGGTTKGSFTLNGSATTINLDAGSPDDVVIKNGYAGTNLKYGDSTNGYAKIEYTTSTKILNIDSYGNNGEIILSGVNTTAYDGTSKLQNQVSIRRGANGGLCPTSGNSGQNPTVMKLGREENKWTDIYSINAHFTNIPQVYIEGSGYNQLHASYIGGEITGNKVTSLSSSSTDTEYPSAKCVYDNLTNIREVAEGKCKTYVASTTFEAVLSDVGRYRKYDGSTFADETELSNYISGLTSFNKTELTKQNNSIYITSSKYLMLYVDGYSLALYIIKENQIDSLFKVGDVLLIEEVDVPDRWYDGGGYFYKLETSKIDLSTYVPTSRTINNKALTSNISLTASDVGAVASSATAAQTITATGSDTPIIVKGVSNQVCIGFKNQNNVSLGYLGLNNENRVKYLNGDIEKTIAYTEEIPTSVNGLSGGTISSAITVNGDIEKSYGDIKSFSVSHQGYTGGATWYFPVLTFPVDNAGNYASAIIDGRIGGWTAGDMAQFSALSWQRGDYTGQNGGIIGWINPANTPASALNTADLVLYYQSDKTAILYVKCYNYYTFDIKVSTYQSTVTKSWTGSYTTTPSGTLASNGTFSNNAKNLKSYNYNDLSNKPTIPSNIATYTGQSSGCVISWAGENTSPDWVLTTTDADAGNTNKYCSIANLKTRLGVPTNYVTTDTAQTISAVKTFSAQPVFSNASGIKQQYSSSVYWTQKVDSSGNLTFTYNG